MSDIADRLMQLLDGDFVRIETGQLSMKAKVMTHERDRSDGHAEAGRWRHTITFMPVGDSATNLDADRYRVTIEPDPSDGWVVGTLVEEIFIEETLDYEAEPNGEIIDIELINIRE